MPFGWPELVIVLVIVLLIFGPKRLPSLGRQLGGGMREFKDSITRKGTNDADDEPETASAAELTRGAQADPLDPQPDTTHAPVGERDDSATGPRG